MEIHGAGVPGAGIAAVGMAGAGVAGLRAEGVRASGGNSVTTTERPKSIEEAAQAFESMFISQLLRMAREAGEQGQLGEGDSGAATMMEVAEEHLATEISKSGGLGFAKNVVAQMKAR